LIAGNYCSSPVRLLHTLGINVMLLAADGCSGGIPVYGVLLGVDIYTDGRMYALYVGEAFGKMQWEIHHRDARDFHPFHMDYGF
jgi:hypothetical protein